MLLQEFAVATASRAKTFSQLYVYVVHLDFLWRCDASRISCTVEAQLLRKLSRTVRMNRLRQLLPTDLTKRKRRIQRFALFLGLIHATFALRRQAVAPKVEKQVTSTQILIGVISCRARAEKASQVFTDWMQYAGSVSNFQAVVVVGDPFLHTEFVKHGYTLQVRTRDDYENLLHKVLLFFHVAHLLDFDYAVKVDDDTFVYAPQLTKQVRWKSLDYGCVQRSSSVSNMRKHYS